MKGQDDGNQRGAAAFCHGAAGRCQNAAQLLVLCSRRLACAVSLASRRAGHAGARDGLDDSLLTAVLMFGLVTEDNPVFPGM